MPGVLVGEGVKGVEKGWAAEVEVAGGGFSGWRRAVVVVRVRREIGKRAGWRERRRVQRGQIMMGMELDVGGGGGGELLGIGKNCGYWQLMSKLAKALADIIDIFWWIYI